MVNGMVFTGDGSVSMSTLKTFQIRRWTVGLVFKYCPMLLVSSQRQFLNHVYFQARQVGLGTCGSYNCQLNDFLRMLVFLLRSSAIKGEKCCIFIPSSMCLSMMSNTHIALGQNPGTFLFVLT